MDNCFFCTSIQNHEMLDLIDELETELFIAAWDANPITPGHMLIIPKRHAQFMKDLSQAEQTTLIPTVIQAKQYLLTADLVSIYNAILPQKIGTKSEDFLRLALKKLHATHRSPDNFNDGLNDGPAAGQTVPHFHWHIMPRWHGDVEGPQGGIRHMFAGMGNYHQGVQK